MKNDKNWVDFKSIKAAVTLQMVLKHYKVSGLARGEGDELRGRCPIHPRATGGAARSFSANLEKNAFKCFDSNCGAHGNVLDFVAAKEDCSVKDAALKLKDWFRVGDSDIKSEATIESLQKLLLELEVYGSRLAHHASMLLEQEAETSAVREKVLKVLQEVRMES